MSDDQYYDLEACKSTCKKHLLESTVSTSNHVPADKSSAYPFREGANGSRRKAEIEQLEGRLRVLEEEAEMLKEALLGSMEEKTKLISEINEHFNTLQHFMVQRELNRGDLCGHGVQITSFVKHRKAGLLQVLCQESNPSIVNKGLRAKGLG